MLQICETPMVTHFSIRKNLYFYMKTVPKKRQKNTLMV